MVMFSPHGRLYDCIQFGSFLCRATENHVMALDYIIHEGKRKMDYRTYGLYLLINNFNTESRIAITTYHNSNFVEMRTKNERIMNHFFFRSLLILFFG